MLNPVRAVTSLSRSVAHAVRLVALATRNSAASRQLAIDVPYALLPYEWKACPGAALVGSGRGSAPRARTCRRRPRRHARVAQVPAPRGQFDAHLRSTTPISVRRPPSATLVHAGADDEPPSKPSTHLATQTGDDAARDRQHDRSQAERATAGRRGVRRRDQHSHRRALQLRGDQRHAHRQRLQAAHPRSTPAAAPGQRRSARRRRDVAGDTDDREQRQQGRLPAFPRDRRQSRHANRGQAARPAAHGPRPGRPGAHHDERDRRARCWSAISSPAGRCPSTRARSPSISCTTSRATSGGASARSPTRAAHSRTRTAGCRSTTATARTRTTTAVGWSTA